MTLGLIFLSVGLVGVIGNYFYLKKRLRTLAHGGYEAGD